MENDAKKIKISICEITKVFHPRGTKEEVCALGPISFDIYAGEFFSLIGPSGCGKSTLLFLIAGLYAPSGGHIKLDNQQVTSPGSERGMVFQVGGIFPWMNVLQNVSYGLKFKRMGKKERADVAQKYIDLVRLKGFEKSYIYELSGGMQSRVKLAMVLANDPEVILMDEPFAALDAQTKAFLQEELERIWEATKKTIVFVTHELREATFLSDRVGVVSARPGCLKNCFEVKLKRPRRVHYSDRSGKEFHEAYKLLYGSIREEADKVMQQMLHRG